MCLQFISVGWDKKKGTITFKVVSFVEGFMAEKTLF